VRFLYRVADAFLYAANCHCSRCRAATGSAFKAFAGIQRSKLEIEEGSGNLLVHGSDELNDTRCGTCGSLLFSVVRDGEYVHVAMAPSSMSPASGQLNTSLSARMRRGSRSPMTYRKKRSTSSPAPESARQRTVLGGLQG
jgi:hypothetical protein